MKSRYARDARSRAKPAAERLESRTLHHGDEFDEILPDNHTLSVRPVRDYTPKVKQTWDDVVPDAKPDFDRSKQMGPLLSGAEPVITINGDFDSFRAAFDKRSNSQPDKDDDCTVEFQREAHKLWDEVFQTVHFETFDVDEMMIERWLNKMDPVKQARMVAALDRLPECDSDAKYLGAKQLFVKVEALLKRYDNKWAPRLIYQGNDEFNALTGPIAMVVCERMIELFNKTTIGSLKVKMAYKANDVDLAEFLRASSEEGFNECFEADFSANDLRQRHFANVIFQKVCVKLGAPRWFASLLDKMSEFTVVNHQFGLRAELANQLPTGTTITTPRNTIWNVTIEAVHAAITRNKGRCVVLGDDYLGMMLRKVSASIEEWVASHPKMKLTPAWPSLSGQATFLSRRVITYTDKWCMVPKIGKALARFNARASSNAAVSDSAYMAGKALSYAYEFRHMPQMRDLFIARFKSEEDNALINVDEVSWFTRTSGIELKELESLIYKEKVVLSEDQTFEFMMDAYGDDVSTTEVLELAQRVICSKEITSLEWPQELEIDM